MPYFTVPQESEPIAKEFGTRAIQDEGIGVTAELLCTALCDGGGCAASTEELTLV
jgi:hypothetical protein